MGTAFGSPTWAGTTVYTLPSDRPPFLYAINEGPPNAPPKVELVPVTYTINSSSDSGGDPQPEFKTVTVTGPPTLGPNNVSFAAANGQAIFQFNRDILAIIGAGVAPLSTGTVPAAAISGVTPCILDKNASALIVPLKALATGKSYTLTVQFSYALDAKSNNAPIKPPTAAAPLSCASSGGPVPPGLLKATSVTFTVN